MYLNRTFTYEFSSCLSIADVYLPKQGNKGKKDAYLYEYEEQCYFIHLFFKYLLGICHIPDTTLGAKNTTVGKNRFISYLVK